jgi:hypothetical protein
VKKGDTVRSTGKGKTKSWGNYIGTVTRVEKEKVYVIGILRMDNLKSA